jgi:large subunit ribosomal protein L21
LTQKILAKMLVSCIILPIMATKTTKDAFAVIATGGKQYVVHEGDTLAVELLGEHKEGDKIEFDTVLMIDDGSKAKVGSPTTGTKVTASYLGVKKGPKLTIVRYKAKSNRDRRVGHRQHYAEVKIEKIG